MLFIILVVVATVLASVVFNWVGNKISPDAALNSVASVASDDSDDVSAYLTDPTSIDYMLFSDDE